MQSRGGRCDPSSCCPQGRDAGDQHIIDVVLKMMQGEGVTSTHCTSTQRVGPHWPCCPIPSHTGPSLPYRAAGGSGCQRQESSPGGSRCHGPPRTPRASRTTWGARSPRTHGSSRRSWPPGCRRADRQHRTQRWAGWASVLWGKKQRLLWRLSRTLPSLFHSLQGSAGRRVSGETPAVGTRGCRAHQGSQVNPQWVLAIAPLPHSLHFSPIHCTALDGHHSPSPRNG